MNIEAAKSMVEEAGDCLDETQREQSSVFTMYKTAATSRFRTRMTRIARIFTDPCISVQSVFYCIPSVFIGVHLLLIKFFLPNRYFGGIQ
jgi:hypothetical protein